MYYYKFASRFTGEVIYIPALSLADALKLASERMYFPEYIGKVRI